MKTQRQRENNSLTVPPQILPDLFRSVARDLSVEDDVRFQGALRFLEKDDVLSFLDLVDSWSQQQYETPHEHFVWNQLACLLKKYPFVVKNIDPEGAAMKKFHHSEHRCRRMN